MQLQVSLLDLLVLLLKRKQRDNLIEGDLPLLSLYELIKMIHDLLESLVSLLPDWRLQVHVKVLAEYIYHFLCWARILDLFAQICGIFIWSNISQGSRWLYWCHGDRRWIGLPLSCFFFVFSDLLLEVHRSFSSGWHDLVFIPLTNPVAVKSPAFWCTSRELTASISLASVEIASKYGRLWGGILKILFVLVFYFILILHVILVLFFVLVWIQELVRPALTALVLLHL